ncbi:ammonium transporter AmtB-like domain-containing protein [Aspergillus coremiiformis]|uniref:Ammonium transporter AmtB-like domain-containing protein n=1 Tax=Aspergillus coremiiformis TaxID=138285 RepID=A0A5N6YYG9_9EURO|nr:ammonium transporter AmtB-like domain-containing protein [Aspergillus coremiiformis]
MPQGGDPTTVDVNAQCAGLEYHYVYITACTFIVFLILPGIAFLYSGLTRRKSALALLFQGFMILAVTTFQWLFWGYSLAYSRNGGPFIGTLENFGLMNVMVAPSPGSAVLPDVVFCLFQLLFCACTVMIVVGGAFERGSILPSLIFSFFWATIVYCPLARWTWSSNGWLYKFEAIDFAGGGPRMHHGEHSLRKPHNTTLVFLGTVLVWTGWLGFNGGSSLNASMRAMVAIFNTNTAGCMGILGGHCRSRGNHPSGVGCVSLWLAACIGFITGIVCSALQNINGWMRIDEGMAVFKLHGIGGMVGAFLTGLFASESISALDGATLTGGAIDGNGIQVGRQLAEICAIARYSFVVSYILLVIFKYFPGMHLRVDEESEMMGLDQAQFFDEQIGDWSIANGMDSLMLMGVSEVPPS